MRAAMRAAMLPVPPGNRHKKARLLVRTPGLDWIGCLSGNLPHRVLRWVKPATFAFRDDAIHRVAIAKERFAPSRSDPIGVFNFHILYLLRVSLLSCEKRAILAKHHHIYWRRNCEHSRRSSLRWLVVLRPAYPMEAARIPLPRSP